MSSRISIQNLVTVIGQTLSSIDVRTASVRIGEDWHNVMTIVRTSEMKPEQVKEDIEHLWGEHGPLNTDEFRIDYKVMHIDSWPDLATEFREGFLRFDNLRIGYGRSVDLCGSLGYIQLKHNFLLPETVWPTLEVSIQTAPVPDASRNPQYKIFTDSVQRSVNLLGYPGPLDAVNALLGARLSQGTISADIYACIPVMARITEVSLSPSEKIFEIKGCCHTLLARGLRAFGYSLGQFEDPRLRTELTLSADDKTFKASGPFARRENSEHVEAKLVHREIGDIFWSRWRVRDLLPEADINPLYLLLKKFCSQDEFTSLLNRPHSVRPTRTKPQDEFERHVAWLLACFGFSTIHLGAHEDLLAQNTRLKRGSLDLLAYHPHRKLVVLGACTLNVPKDEDYGKLLSIRSMLFEDSDDLPFTCEAVMFCGVPGCTPQSNGASVDDFNAWAASDRVVVFDSDRLTDAIQWLQSRNEEQFFATF